MKRLWTVEELIVQWPVSSTDRELLYRRRQRGGSASRHSSRFFASFRLYARFPEHRGELAPVVIDHLAEQIGVLRIASAARCAAPRGTRAASNALIASTYASWRVETTTKGVGGG